VASSTSTGVAVHDRCSRALPLAPSSISCSVRAGLPDRGVERGAVAEDLRGPALDELLARQLEQVLGGGVGPGHASVLGDQQHRRREHFEARAGRGRDGLEERDADHGYARPRDATRARGGA